MDAEALVADTLGCGEHTDYGCLTFINSDASPGALHVKTARDQWVAAEPVDGAFTTNLGVRFR
jgi:isopenicillin N synthase-like dioxygenase